MLRNSRQNSPARAHFFDLLRHHWTEGTGNKVPGKWTASSFATEMGRAGIKSLDAKTMQAWLDGARWPGRARKDAILDVFFPDSTARPRSEEAKSARDAMEDAWRDGQSERSTSDVTAQDAHLGDDWIIEDPEHHTDIAAIELHQPTRTN